MKLRVNNFLLYFSRKKIHRLIILCSMEASPGEEESHENRKKAEELGEFRSKNGNKLKEFVKAYSESQKQLQQQDAN